MRIPITSFPFPLRLALLLLLAAAPAGADPADPPALAVRLEPPADAWRRPWSLHLLGATDDGRWTPLAKAGTNAAGLGVLRDLEPQEARLEVRDADGRQWLSMLVDVYPGSPELFLPVDLVAVEGKLSFGDQPLAGLAAFGRTKEGEWSAAIGMRSGKDGKFQGYLPDEGYWSVALADELGQPLGSRPRVVEVRRRPGKTYAEVAIEVPPTVLTGRVFTPDSQPAAGATVTVLREPGPLEGWPRELPLVGEVSLMTGGTGRFYLKGVEPGTLVIRASRGRESSDWERFELREGDLTDEFVLVIEERELVRGTVSAGNQLIAGAKIVAHALGLDGRLRRTYMETVSGPNGEIELEVPAGALFLDLLVAAPDYGVEALRFERRANGWPPFLLRLEEGKGRLRVPPEAENSGLLLRRNGAYVSWQSLLRVLRGQRRSQGPVLGGMAAGTWELCPLAAPEQCRGGYLPDGGELSLESP